MKQKQTWDEKVFDIIMYALVVLLIIIFAYPLYYLVICSFSDINAVFNGEVKLLPVGFSLESYEMLLGRMDIWRGYAISLGIVVAGTVVNLFATLICSYVLACPEFLPRKGVMKFITMTMFFSAGLIPNFLLMKSLGLYNNLLVLIIPGAINVQNMIIARTFFENNIPNALREAAFLDGCSHVKLMGKIMLPLSKPIIAVLALYYGVAHWNSYFNAMIYITNDDFAPLQLVLRRILLTASSAEATGADLSTVIHQVRMAEQLKYSSVVVASVPALVAYPFVQKYFVKGVMIGGVKE